MKSESFKIKMNEQWFRQKSVFRIPLRRRIYRWFENALRKIGIFVSWDCRVIDTPKQVEDGYSYSLMKVAKNYHVFFLKVYSAPTKYVAGIDPYDCEKAKEENEKNKFIPDGV